MKRINLDTLRWEERKSPTGKFHSYFRDVSVALGGIRNVGTWGGGHPFDVQVRRVPAGAAICPYHSHLAQWELFVVQAGTGTVRVGDAATPVRSGDVFVHPPGQPHQLTNTGTEELVVLIVADNPQLDAFHYPDSKKWGLRPPNTYFRMSEVDYFDGEDAIPRSALHATAPSVDVPPLQKLHLDDLPWESWQSPKEKFRGTSKELSIALGAKPDTPTGLGGHPFDLELSKLAPGESGCPFHSHLAQWELFLILEGQGMVRAGAETVSVGPGDGLLHPPGEAHQITNAGDGELMFYLIADNPPVEACYYPDSNKWGFREPRMFFRATAVDLWDGEE